MHQPLFQLSISWQCAFAFPFPLFSASCFDLFFSCGTDPLAMGVKGLLLQLAAGWREGLDPTLHSWHSETLLT